VTFDIPLFLISSPSLKFTLSDFPGLDFPGGFLPGYIPRINTGSCWRNSVADRGP